MKANHRHSLLLVGFVALYVLHNDLWYWHDSRIVFGLPIGLLYHIGFCLVASLWMYLLVRFAWPRHLEVENESDVQP